MNPVFSNWLRKMTQERDEYLNDKIKTLKPGQILCVHDHTNPIEEVEENRYKASVTTQTHVLEEDEECDRNGQRAQYIKA